VSENATACPSCGAGIIGASASRDYVAKLMAALSHPEPTTPIRAATILGRLAPAEAVAPLLHVLRGPADAYIKSAAAETLGEIGAQEAREVLAEAR